MIALSNAVDAHVADFGATDSTGSKQVSKPVTLRDGVHFLVATRGLRVTVLMVLDHSRRTTKYPHQMLIDTRVV